MRIALLTQSVSRRGGGLADAVRGLALALADHGHEVHVFALDDGGEGAALPPHEGLTVRLFPVRGPASLGYAPGMRRALLRAEPEVVHLHGLWTWLSVLAHAWGRRTGGPVVVSPHGMLDAWALRHARWKKRVAAALYENRTLRGAAALHALCEPEAEAIRDYGLKGPIRILPNGIPLPGEAGAPGAGDGAPEGVEGLPGDARVCLSLGRLHPKKNLPALLSAWAGASGSPAGARWWLLIAGWDEGGHAEDLRRQIAREGLDRVRLVGPAFGAAKARLYRRAEAFVLPSLSEGLPMVVLEAWSHALPVLMTPRCNLAVGARAGAAWLTETDPASLAAGLKTMMRADGRDLRAMGERGLALVRRQFAWSHVAGEMAGLYAGLRPGPRWPERAATGVVPERVT